MPYSQLMTFGSLTPEQACQALREAGLELSPADIRLEAREDRWLVWLSAGRAAWFPATMRGRERLGIDRKVLRLLAERCTFPVPHILFEASSGFDVRALVPGACDPWPLYRRVIADHALARSLGAAVGRMLVEQHTRIVASDVAGWLPRRVAWPMPGDWIRERLPGVVDDQGLLAELCDVIRLYENVAVDPPDRVLVHADLGLHNLAVDDRTDALAGVFDYDEAAWADRHHDFRYLVFDAEPSDMLEAALGVYEPKVGRSIDRARVRLYNAACAISFLALRRGLPAQDRSAGRTLEEDMRWVRHALALVAS